MNDKKKMARLAMLKQMSKAKGSELHEPSIGKKMAEKKLSKVTVMAEDDKGLAKGLTKAQQILKSKLGEMFDEKDESEDEETEEHDEDCPGCELCEEEDEE